VTHHRLTVVLLLIAFGSRETASQDTATPKAFDVASVKSNTSGNAGRMLSPLPGGRFVATNVTLRQLIAFAFGVPNSHFEMIVIGGPDWIDADRFDVEARVSTGDVPRGQSGPLVRALLEERFQLRAHRETRDRPIYQLVVDRADRRLGPGLRSSTTDCNATANSGAGAAPRPRCGLTQTPGSTGGLGVTIPQLADALAPFAGRVIVERTGLEQLFDIDLKWTPDATPASDAPGLLTAIREQLGLRLETARGPVEVLVVDAVGQLTPN
jgi:uncharacterized protein (TIGR03435 family)